jgi:hypothetical protein
MRHSRDSRTKATIQTRKRGQRGFVRGESGNWRGYYNVNVVVLVTGKTKYRQQSAQLGLMQSPRAESEVKAYDALRAQIQRVTGGRLGARPDPGITLQKFTETRWLPLRDAKWRPSSKASTMHTLSHIFAKFGSVPLERLDKVELQTSLNQLTEKHSKSLVLHAKFYLKSILAEVQDQHICDGVPPTNSNPHRRSRLPTTFLDLNNSVLRSLN